MGEVYAMLWQHVQSLPESRFKRATGVPKAVFGQMAEAVSAYKKAMRKHPSRGAPSKLSIEDRVLMLLMYYREYRTMAHIGLTYRISESRVCETIREMEAILIQDPRFHLPGKKALVKAEPLFDVVLVDVTETPCERPKKNNAGGIRVKRSGTPSKPR
jgi:hypothetical protein